MALLGNLTGSSQFFNNTEFYNGVIGQSLRLSKSSDYKLDRQMVTPTSVTGTICTASWWMKKCAHGTVQSFIQCRDNQASGNYNAYWSYDSGFGANDHHAFFNEVDSINVGTNTTIMPYRDPASWYHVVIRYDSTQGTAANRIRIYINGVNQVSTFSTTTYPSQNAVNTFWNNAGEHLILFGNGEDSGDSFDGYIAEVNWVDGLSLAPESFGELKNGVWIPIEYTGSYGLNGSRYTFADSSDIGKDTSGVGNDLDRVSNLAASDVVSDSPENNFCTWNPLTIGAQGTLAEGNLKNTAFWSSDLSGNASTFFPESGKWYWELRIDGAGTYPYIGITSQEKTNDTVNGGTFYNIAWRPNGTGVSSGSSLGTITKENIPSFADDAIISFALDVDARKLWVAENNTYADSGDPANGSGENASWTVDVDVSPFAMGYQSQGVGTIANFGQDDTFAGAISSAGNTDSNGKGVFKYAPPSGFLALCTSNLPEPTISPNSTSQAYDHFNTVLYTGTGADKTVSGVGFQPDWVWFKRRNGTKNHGLFDSSRGATKKLESNTADAEETVAETLKSFNSDGYVIGNDSVVNTNTDTYVAWNWKANGGTTVTNNDGDGTSTVQANTTAGFSIVTYTGSSNESYGHGLDSAPEMIIVKGRNVGHNWAVYHQGVQDGTANGFLELNTTAAKATGSNPRFLNGTTSTSQPTNTVFNVNHYSGSSTNASNNSDTYIAYCFHSVEGFSRFGSYTGNGNADGTFVFTGFRPAFIIFKRIDSTNHWLMLDDKRDTYNVVHKFLLANTSDDEDTSNDQDTDFTSNGFKVRNSNARNNASGGTYIYMAFAEAPFKYANAR